MFLICIVFSCCSASLFSLTWTTSGDGNYQATNSAHTYNYKPNIVFTPSYGQADLDAALIRTTVDTETSSQSKWAYDYATGNPEDNLGSFRWLITDPKGGNGFAYNADTHQFSPNLWSNNSSSGPRRESGIWTFDATTKTWTNNYTNVSWQYYKSTKTWHSITESGLNSSEIKWKYDSENDVWLFQPNEIDWYTFSEFNSVYDYTDPSSPWYNTPAHERWFSWKLHDQFIWEYHYTDDLNGMVSSDLKCITIIDSRTGTAQCKPYSTEAGYTLSAPLKNPGYSSEYTRWFVPQFDDVTRELAELNTQTPYNAFSGSGSFPSGYVKSWRYIHYGLWNDLYISQTAQSSNPKAPNAPPSFLWKIGGASGTTKIPPDYFVLPPLVVTMHQEIISAYLSLENALANAPTIWTQNNTVNSYSAATEYDTDAETAPLKITTDTTQLLYNIHQAPTASKLSSFQHKKIDNSEVYEFNPATGTWSNTNTGDSLTYGVVAAKKWANTHEITWQYNENTKTWTQLVTTAL